MKKVLFVCTGNTCRSPMAKVLFEKYLNDNNIKNISVDSAGIFAGEGDSASFNAIEAMKENKIDLSFHKAKKINESLINESDFIFVMSESHKAAISSYFGRTNNVFVLNNGISDPYGQDLNEYKKTAKEIEASFDNLVSIILNNEKE